MEGPAALVTESMKPYSVISYKLLKRPSDREKERRKKRDKQEELLRVIILLGCCQVVLGTLPCDYGHNHLSRGSFRSKRH
jgi:hypothetical protein